MRKRKHDPLLTRYGHTHPKDHLDDPYGECIEKEHVDSLPYDTVLRCPYQLKTCGSSVPIPWFQGNQIEVAETSIQCQ